MGQHFSLIIICLKSINHTYQVLIPKTLHTQTPSDYRPISLCNFSYKIISKIISSRLKTLLDKIITPTQCAYVPRRHIQKNFIFSHEMIDFMKKKRKGKTPFIALKLDISKAFDRLE